MIFARILQDFEISSAFLPPEVYREKCGKFQNPETSVRIQAVRSTIFSSVEYSIMD